MEKLSKTTGAKIISNLKEITPFELGGAERVKEIRHGENIMTYVYGCKNPKSLTILIRGGTEHILDEVERAMKDGLGDVRVALISGRVVAGGGAVEVELSKRLRAFAITLTGREQLAVEAFADAMEVIPRTLAENAGIDPIDSLTELKSAHDKKQKWAGIDVFSGKVMDAWKRGVIEPLKIKTQAISSASEVAVMILRIDDVIAGSGKSGGGMPQMPPGGMGGMPGGMDM